MSKFKISLQERLLHKLYLCTQGLRASRNRKHLLHDDFTIISNNCWGGMTSEVYGLRKNTPTVGCYFFPDDYLKFIERLKYYVGVQIMMVNHPMPEFKSALYYPGFEDKKYLENDTFWGHRYFDVTRFLNTGIIVPLRKGWLRMLFGIS